MENAKIQQLLTNLGLTEHEAQVYFSALSLGPSTILEIARNAGIKRTTVYSVVDALQSKGLMRIDIRGLKKLYAAENPEKLTVMLEHRRTELNLSLPDLLALYDLKGGESLIKYYQGIEGTKVAYENVLATVGPRDDYMVISDEQKWSALDPIYFENFRARRAKKMKTQIRMLFQDTPGARKIKKYAANYNSVVKLLPPQTELTTNLIVTPQQVLIQQLVPPILTILISNKSVIQMHKEMFEIMWSAIP